MAWGMLMLGLGGVNVLISDSSVYPHHYTRFPSKSAYVFELMDEPQEKAKTWKLKVGVRACVDTLGNLQPCFGKAILFLNREVACTYLPQLADCFVAEVDFQDFQDFEVDGKKIPYQKIQRRKSYYKSSYVSRPCQYLNSKSWNWGTLRMNLRQKLPEILPTSSGQSMASALVLGDKMDLDADLQTAYREVGVVHVLCVSGMHLGIFASLMLYIFSFWNRKSPQKYNVYVLLPVLGCIWGYAFLSGAGISVMRAAFMFSFVMVGKCLKRRVSIYQSLCISAWLLLLIQPMWIYEVGFQLSYLAILGIVGISPFLKRCFRIDTQPKWLQKIFELLVVSLAAQCATFPICLYYFGQFPIYFLLGNMLVLPIVSVLLPLGIGMIASLLIWKPLAQGLGVLFTILSEWMNRGVHWIQSLPFSVWNVSVSLLGCCGIYMFYWMLWSFYTKRRKTSFYGALSLCLIGVIYG